jgi:hypothetical protein
MSHQDVVFYDFGVSCQLTQAPLIGAICLGGMMMMMMMHFKLQPA